MSEADKKTNENSQLPNVTIDQFNSVNFEEPIKSLTCVVGHSFEKRFEKAAKKAEASGDKTGFSVYRLLCAICSVHFTPEDTANPWAPMMSIGNQRTPIPPDFAGEQNAVLAAISPNIKNAVLRSRISDFVWTNDRRQKESASQAIQAYCECVDLNSP